MEPEEAVDYEIKVVEAKKVRCPYCRRDTRQRQYGKTGSVAYYKCLHCVFPDGSGDNTRYKVIFT